MVKVRGFCCHPRVIWLVVFSLTLALFSYLQTVGTFADPDSFYHAKLTILLRDTGIVREFPWTQSSLYKDIFIDHHLGYHLLLIPFVSVFPELVGLQIATVLFATFSVLAVLWCLKKWRVDGWWGWLILLLTAAPFVFRLSLGKAPSIGIGVAVIAYYLITERKLSWLFWWTWFFTWLYSAWLLTLVMAIVYLIVESFSQLPFGLKLITKRLFAWSNFKLILIMLTGVTAGIVINPYFPNNLFYLKHLFAVALVPYSKLIGVGAEWYPFSPFDLPVRLTYPLLGWILTTIVGFFSFKRQSVLSRSTWCLAVVFLIYTLRARRQVEYLTPWLIMSSALLLRDWGLVWSWQNLLKLWQKFYVAFPRWLKRKVVLIGIAVYLVLLVPWWLVYGVQTTKNALASGFSFEMLKPASTWLAGNTPTRSIIWQTDWGSFPMLFYHNTSNYYLTGLDQTYMYEYNQDKYWQWIKIDSAEYEGDVYKVIKETFKASYVLVEKRVGAMLRYINRDSRFSKVYEDKEVIIYKL
jgi:hypothetical protein